MVQDLVTKSVVPVFDIYKLPAFIISVIMVSGVLSVVAAYVNWITGLAYADNLVGVYKDKIMDNSTPELVEDVEE